MMNIINELWIARYYLGFFAVCAFCVICAAWAIWDSKKNTEWMKKNGIID